uniref:Uncharacterized protein n=1 Tax=Aegilops tauschii TaxID=37682 RepID=M8B2C8_AEGTA
MPLARAYRLIAVDEVTRAVQARKEEKTRRAQRQRQQASAGNDQSLMDEGLDQLEQQDRDGHPSSSTKGSRHRRELDEGLEASPVAPVSAQHRRSQQLMRPSAADAWPVF